MAEIRNQAGHLYRRMDSANVPAAIIGQLYRQRWSIEEAVRRLTSDTADLFGIRDRGRLVPGAFADVNVIDFDGLALPPPTYAYDFPHGAGRYVQGATGYDCTLVNGQVFMERGEHTGAFAGQLLRNANA